MSKLLWGIVGVLWLVVNSAFGFWLADIHKKVNNDYFVHAEHYRQNRKELCDRIDRFENSMVKRFDKLDQILEKMREAQKNP